MRIPIEEDDLTIKAQAYKSIIEQQQRKIDELQNKLQEERGRHDKTICTISDNLVELQNILDNIYALNERKQYTLNDMKQ